MTAFLDDVNGAFPGLELTQDEVLHVYSGLLPATQKGSATLTKADRWIDHGEHGGPKGLFSVQGTKFTAARATAEEGMAHIFPDRTVSDQNVEFFQRRGQRQPHPRGLFDHRWEPDPDDLTWRRELAHIVREEAVMHLDDLVLRRTSLGDNPRRALQIAPRLCGLFDWTEERCREEIQRVEEHFPRARRSSSPTDERV
jgi:glycerol-3-phosphate dehydrogenase